MAWSGRALQGKDFNNHAMGGGELWGGGMNMQVLKEGDEVFVRKDDGRIEKHIVRTAPWQLGHGTWVVGLSDISGGYDLRRVVSVNTQPDISEVWDRR